MEPEQTIRYLGIVTESLNNREETEKVFTGMPNNKINWVDSILTLQLTQLPGLLSSTIQAVASAQFHIKHWENSNGG